ncbi:uncharacterized protein VTP21DRAFT_8636 [Calcarisporiella thermophila]|uniref:uncharacterized protein n=1 Tax=Calcarisporiella thermophila TaxID=911321 RepID=UPI003744540E
MPPTVSEAPQAAKVVHQQNGAANLVRNKISAYLQDSNFLEPRRPNSPSWKQKYSASSLKSYKERIAPSDSEISMYKSMTPSKISRGSTEFADAESAYAMNPRKKEEEIQELIKSIPSEVDDVTMDVKVPSDLLITLMPHQLHGLKWLVDRERDKKSGGILADMGLGKTIQTLSLMLSNRSTDANIKTTLIVAPLALIRQWECEIKSKTTPESLSVYVHHGPSRTKDPKRLMRYDVVVTTYQVVALEWPKGEKIKSKKNDKESESDDDSDLPKATKSLGPLFRAKFYRVVLDEAQTIKNKSTRSAIGCTELSAVKRWCLTGTPIQNNVDELYSLFKFLRVKPYDDYPTFKHQIVSPLQQGRAKTALQRLQVVLKAIMLRRTKDHKIDGKPLLNLPTREVKVLRVDFNPQERAFYDTLKERMDAIFDRFVDAGNVSKNYTNILCLLLRLRQVQRGVKESDAVELLTNPFQVRDEDESVESDLANMMGKLDVREENEKSLKCVVCLELLPEGWKKEHCYMCEAQILDKKKKDISLNFTTSTKIEHMLNVLEETRKRDPKEKTIIFSQFTSMLDLIEEHIREKNFVFVRYDGSMSNKAREESLYSLRTDPNVTVMLLSLKCGSLGWNPAVEEQAIDRVHRIGQTKPVRVNRLTIADTVEDKIVELQEKKRELAKGALGELNSTRLNKLSVEDLLYLFRDGPLEPPRSFTERRPRQQKRDLFGGGLGRTPLRNSDTKRDAELKLANISPSRAILEMYGGEDPEPQPIATNCVSTDTTVVNSFVPSIAKTHFSSEVPSYESEEDADEVIEEVINDIRDLNPSLKEPEPSKEESANAEPTSQKQENKADEKVNEEKWKRHRVVRRILPDSDEDD